MFIPPFIHLPVYRDICARLNDGLKAGGIVLLIGEEGTSKTRLLKQFALTELTAIDIDQLAGVQLSRPKKIDTGRNGSTVTLDLYTKLLRDLRLLFTVPQSEERALLRDRLQDDPKRQSFADDRFKDLFYLVCDGMRKMRGLVIDNSQHIDDITLEQVIELWETLDKRFGIIICVQQQVNEDVTRRAQLTLGSVPRAAKSCLDIIELPRMNMAEFSENVFDTWLKGMNAELSSKLQAKRDRAEFKAKAWLVTKGD